MSDNIIIGESNIPSKNIILMRDVDGKPIKVGDRFSFTFLGQLDGNFNLVGSFQYNPDELRYEIDVEENNHRFMVLSYDYRTIKIYKLL